MAHPGYIWTFDNPRGGDYRRPARELAKVGSVQRHVPKTTLHVDRYDDV